MQCVNVFDIQRFSYHDGPGIRTVVFLKGCSLRCFWCQNPESQSAEREMFLDSDKCIACGKCFRLCPNGCHLLLEDGSRLFKRDLCTKCGRCATECYAGALQVIGTTIPVEAVMDLVQRDLPFYRLSGGGVTLSGGEPLLQERGCYELLRSCKDKGISTAIETAGNVSWSAFETVLPVTDYVLFDVKTLDGSLHQRTCGATNVQVLSNLERLGSYPGVKLIVRVPVIPTVNDNEREIGLISRWVKGFANLQYMELIPFHKLGSKKYQALGRTYHAGHLAENRPERIRELERIVRANGVPMRNASDMTAARRGSSVVDKQSSR